MIPDFVVAIGCILCIIHATITGDPFTRTIGMFLLGFMLASGKKK